MADRPRSHTSDTSTTTVAPHHAWIPFSGPVLFTGPSGLGDFRAKGTDYPHAVGNTACSTEKTNDLGYLTRHAPGSSFPKAKNGRIGEIGWHAEIFKTVK